MTPATLSVKGRVAGVYGFLDGNRGSSGEVWVQGGDDPVAPPHEGEERRGLWFPRRKPGLYRGMIRRMNRGECASLHAEEGLGAHDLGYGFMAPLEGSWRPSAD